MESYVSIQDVANIILFVVPGYFAIKTYSFIFAKSEKEFSKLLLESIVCSLPIVSIYNLLWRQLTNHDIIPTTARYVLPLLLLSITLGWLATLLRQASFARKFVGRFNLPDADEDFLRLQFNKLGEDELISVALKDGSIFSGTPQAGSTPQYGNRQYCFNDVAWFNKDKNEWEEGTGSIIVDLDDVLYLQTERSLPRY